MSFRSMPNRPKRKLTGVDEDARKQRKTSSSREAPLQSSFDGAMKHGDDLPSPFDRLTAPPQESPAEVAKQDLNKQVVVTCRTNDHAISRGSFSRSFVQLAVEACATSPSVALVVRSYAREARWMIDFDLFQMEDVTATAFDFDPNAPSSDGIALINAVAEADPDFEMKPGQYLRITLKRRAHNIQHKSTDYAMFCDQRVAWTPSTEQANGFPEFQPFRPRMDTLGKLQQETLDQLVSAEHVDIWLNKLDEDIQRQADILQRVTRSGRDDKFRPDWYWTRHPLYDQDPAMHFRRFYHHQYVVKPRQFPERQPWLQVETGDLAKPKYAPVWRKTKTRFSGPGAYRSSMIPALLWEIETTAVQYRVQFNNDQVYFAAFQLRRQQVLVKVKVRGPEVATTHNLMQVIPSAGTMMKIRMKDTPAFASSTMEFCGVVADRVERGWDAMVMCDLPENFRTPTDAMKEGVKVLLSAEYSNMQDDIALAAIDTAAALAETERVRGPDTVEDRLPWRVSSHTGGAHVSQLSKDFYGDWADNARAEGQLSEHDAAVDQFVTVTLYEGLNTEQKQAYLLSIRGTPKAQLGLEGCPGTGKSRTLSHITLALLAMGYSVFLSAQSNNGVDAVFEKVAEATEKYPAMVSPDLLARYPASTIERHLITSLLSAWQKGSTLEVPDDISSSISRSNIPYTSSYKIARFLHLNPDDELSKNWHAWSKATAESEASFQTGSVRRPAGATAKRSATYDDLIDAVYPTTPRLFGATAAAARRDSLRDYAEALELSFDVLIFDEASQATEASFMSAATARIMQGVKLVMLGGDTKQLPPVIQSTFQNPFGDLLAMSALERMLRANHDSAIVNLLQNYRSHQDIVRLASMLFYNNRMVAGRKLGDSDDLVLGPQKLKLKDFMRSLSSKVYLPWMAENQRNSMLVRPPYNGRVWIIDTPGFSQKAPESHSSFNDNGVRVSCNIAQRLADKLGPEHVQIITMYGYEVGYFRKSKALPKGVVVKTVDSFQGLEDIAIVLHGSAAFHNKPNPLGHISNERRLNVALTRARELMVIVGNFSFWEDRIVGTGKDSTGVPKFKMEPAAPFHRLLTEARKAKMVVPVLSEWLGGLPDIYVKRGKVGKDLPKRFVNVKDRRAA
jgi:hypothetical protein